ncbi:MAG: hypothetical protein ABIS67_14750, partial [Candidatus Eisenbacteria bacterium]
MHTRFRFILPALLALIAVSPALAEPVENFWTVTPYAGFTIFDGDMRFPAGQPLKDNINFGGRLGYQARRWMGIEAAAGFTPTEEDVIGTGTKVDWFHANGDLMFTPFASRFGGPFL